LPETTVIQERHDGIVKTNQNGQSSHVQILAPIQS
jgi:hypothetical protein